MKHITRAFWVLAWYLLLVLGSARSPLGGPSADAASGLGQTLTPPTNFMGVGVDPSHIQWSWTDGLGETHYELHDAAHNVIATIPADTTSFLEGGLTPNTQFCRHVAAIAGSLSAESNTACATTLPEDVCASIANVISEVQELISTGDIPASFSSAFINKLETAKKACEADNLRKAGDHILAFTQLLDAKWIQTEQITENAWIILDDLVWTIYTQIQQEISEDEGWWVQKATCQFTEPSPLPAPRVGFSVTVNYTWQVNWHAAHPPLDGEVEVSVNWFAGDRPLKPKEGVIVVAQPVGVASNFPTGNHPGMGSFTFATDMFTHDQRDGTPLADRAEVTVKWSGTDAAGHTWGKGKGQTKTVKCRRRP